MIPFTTAIAIERALPGVYLMGDYYDGLLLNADIATIAWQFGTTVRFVFAGSPDLSGVSTGDRLYALDTENFIHSAKTMTISAIGTNYVDVVNPSVTSGLYDESNAGHAWILSQNRFKTVTIQAHIQPLRHDLDLDNPQGVRWQNGRVRIYSVDELLTSEKSPANQADRFQWQGRWYEVQQVSRWDMLPLSHWRAYAGIIDEKTENS